MQSELRARRITQPVVAPALGNTYDFQGVSKTRPLNRGVAITYVHKKTILQGNAQEQPRAAGSSQGQPGAAKEQPRSSYGAARLAREQPGSSQEQPGSTQSRQPAASGKANYKIITGAPKGSQEPGAAREAGEDTKRSYRLRS